MTFTPIASTGMIAGSGEFRIAFTSIVTIRYDSFTILYNSYNLFTILLDSTQFQATVGQITSTSEMITTSAGKLDVASHCVRFMSDLLDLGISDAQAPISYDSEGKYYILLIFIQIDSNHIEIGSTYSSPLSGE